MTMKKKHSKKKLSKMKYTPPEIEKIRVGSSYKLSLTPAEFSTGPPSFG